MKQPDDLPGHFQAAWNAHDMLAFAALFHEDATFVNRFGHYVRGVDEIVRLHEPITASLNHAQRMIAALEKARRQHAKCEL